MPGRSRSIATRRLAALAMTALLLGGCSTWRMQGQVPATAVSASPSPPHVRITLGDSTRIELYDAVVESDSLVGASAPVPSRDFSYGRPTVRPTRIAVALRDIRTLEIRTHSGGKTKLLVTGIVVGVLTACIILAASGGGILTDLVPFR